MKSFAEIIKKSSRSAQMETSQRTRLCQLFEQFEMYPEEEYTLSYHNSDLNQRSQSVRMFNSKNTNQCQFDSWIQRQAQIEQQVYNKENQIETQQRKIFTHQHSLKNHFFQQSKPKPSLKDKLPNNIQKINHEGSFRSIQNTLQPNMQNSRQDQIYDQNSRQDQIYDQNSRQDQIYDQNSRQDQIYDQIPFQRVKSPKTFQQENQHYEPTQIENQFNLEHEVQTPQNNFISKYEDTMKKPENIHNIEEENKRKKILDYTSEVMKNIHHDIEFKAKEILEKQNNEFSDEELLIGGDSDKKPSQFLSENINLNKYQSENPRRIEAKMQINQLFSKMQNKVKQKQVYIAPATYCNVNKDNEVQVGYSFSQNAQDSYNVQSNEREENQRQLQHIEEIQSEMPAQEYYSKKIEDSDDFQFRKKYLQPNVDLEGEHIKNIQSVHYSKEGAGMLQSKVENRFDTISDYQLSKKQLEESHELEERQQKDATPEIFINISKQNDYATIQSSTKKHIQNVFKLNQQNHQINSPQHYQERYSFARSIEKQMKMSFHAEIEKQSIEKNKNCDQFTSQVVDFQGTSQYCVAAILKRSQQKVVQLPKSYSEFDSKISYGMNSPKMEEKRQSTYIFKTIISPQKFEQNLLKQGSQIGDLKAQETKAIEDLKGVKPMEESKMAHTYQTHIATIPSPYKSSQSPSFASHHPVTTYKLSEAPNSITTKIYQPSSITTKIYQPSKVECIPPKIEEFTTTTTYSRGLPQPFKAEKSDYLKKLQIKESITVEDHHYKSYLQSKKETIQASHTEDTKIQRKPLILGGGSKIQAKVQTYQAPASTAITANKSVKNSMKNSKNVANSFEFELDF